ncbi:MAG: carbohydrate ABC transporter permease, partial [Anaerolineae bacterium]|nr:carbohydrate ABC transporter permease [Phycisphaerae bacterium]
TDEELTEGHTLPKWPAFRESSPYARSVPTIAKPADVPEKQWPAVLSRLRHAASTRVNVADVPGLNEAVTAELINRFVGATNRQLWTANSDVVIERFVQFVDQANVASAVDDRLARFELYQLQLRTLDFHIFNLSDEWKVESGDASIAAKTVKYRFDESNPQPIVLRCEFDFPADAKLWHKLMLSIRPDDSWHRIDATLDIGGSRWASQKTTYLAQHRPISLMFQPPTFDDTTLQPRMWIPMKRGDRVEANSNRAVLRIILSPSDTPRAVFGKVMRNFQRAFDFGPFWMYVRNSLLLVALTTIGTLFSSAFVAYAFARLHWPGRSFAMLLLLSTMMLPAQVTMIPSFVIWKSLGWYNTLNPMWVPAFFGGAFFIFLMTQQMKTLPRELEESSRIDGLNAVQTWYYIILPQVKPTAAAIAIMTFMWSWNEFMGPLIYLRDQSKFPLSLGLFVMRLENFGDWTMIMAANTLMTLPVIIIFFLCQRYFIQGISMSGMKG